MFDQLKQDLDKEIVTSQVLLSSAHLVDESSRLASEFIDKRYLPFYYHLGKYIKPEIVVQIKPKLGLPAMCFLKSSTVKRWIILGEKNRFVVANMRLVGNNPEFLKEAKGDVGFLTESGTKEEMEILWNSLRSEGLLIVDYINDSDFKGFCRIVNRDPVLFETRNGVGIIRK